MTLLLLLLLLLLLWSFVIWISAPRFPRQLWLHMQTPRLCAPPPVSNDPFERGESAQVPQYDDLHIAAPRS